MTASAKSFVWLCVLFGVAGAAPAVPAKRRASAKPVVAIYMDFLGSTGWLRCPAGYYSKGGKRRLLEWIGGQGGAPAESPVYEVKQDVLSRIEKIALEFKGKSREKDFFRLTFLSEDGAQFYRFVDFKTMVDVVRILPSQVATRPKYMTDTISHIYRKDLLD
ncbi:hypothetical protein GALL_276240 [mine drainage metagenome]|uniref:Uncharacterized protein n=1 Tax=mine drainage metagenome TaxID=410659 RepID=A0A1J5RQZ1_9ZZZZ